MGVEITHDDLEALRRAKQLLENPSLAARVSPGGDAELGLPILRARLEALGS